MRRNVYVVVSPHGYDFTLFCGGCIGDLYRHNLEEVEFAIRRACGLSKVAERGYILSISGITEDLSVDDWNTWRSSINIAREEI